MELTDLDTGVHVACNYTVACQHLYVGVRHLTRPDG